MRLECIIGTPLQRLVFVSEMEMADYPVAYELAPFMSRARAHAMVRRTPRQQTLPKTIARYPRGMLYQPVHDKRTVHLLRPLSAFGNR